MKIFFSKFSKKINTIRKLIKFCILHPRLSVIGLCSESSNIRRGDDCAWGVKFNIFYIAYMILYHWYRTALLIACSARLIWSMWHRHKLCSFVYMFERIFDFWKIPSETYYMAVKIICMWTSLTMNYHMWWLFHRNIKVDKLQNPSLGYINLKQLKFQPSQV